MVQIALIPHPFSSRSTCAPAGPAGRAKGAAAGATGGGSGGCEDPEGGALCLEGDGETPMDAQPRLGGVLEQGEYRTVGGRTRIKPDVRIVAASNKDLR